jgi:hypothetical protein
LCFFVSLIDPNVTKIVKWLLSTSAQFETLQEQQRALKSSKQSTESSSTETVDEEKTKSDSNGTTDVEMSTETDNNKENDHKMETVEDETTEKSSESPEKTSIVALKVSDLPVS